ncbi:hypothetical protein BDM02DRAFT_3160966 [Thelephora ganbajun]|uniref:Uncharacterized protein n=1 Tax=Thelephora ganbajun TaxID=370292 RepID=A0ACB6ZSD8_THEGA|nr:hypothetical protein BDM02DRAFT_3160966 [Thelephora ganbajun]
MRFLSILFFLSTLSTLPVFARMNQLVSRTSRDHPAIARRQHHSMITSLTDICASIDISAFQVSIVGMLEASASIEVHICICISIVPIFVRTDVRVKDYANRVGEQNAIIAIRDMIKTSDRRHTCQFPHHSTPRVSDGNVCDPCNYGCEETYRKHDGKCVCDAPLFECNGRCALVCGSSRPQLSLKLPDGRH